MGLGSLIRERTPLGSLFPITEIKNLSLVSKRETVLQPSKPKQHVMALYLLPDGNSGLIRVVNERNGLIKRAGFVDKSSLHIIRRENGKFAIEEKELEIEGEKAIINELRNNGLGDLIGREDPTIFINPNTNNIELYYTVAFKKGDSTASHLMYASGPTLDNLVAKGIILENAKEVIILPQDSNRERLALFEGVVATGGQEYSTVNAAKISRDGNWSVLGTLINPADKETVPYWLRGHASPGPVILDLGNGRVAMALNGRAENIIHNNKRRGKSTTSFSPFEIGLCIFNYKKGIIEAISKRPIIHTLGANVTFASYYDEARSTLYAHIDDSRVDSFQINVNSLKKFVGNKNNFIFLYNQRFLS